MLSADDVSRCMSSNGSVHVLCIVDGVDQVMTLLWMVNGGVFRTNLMSAASYKMVKY